MTDVPQIPGYYTHIVEVAGEISFHFKHPDKTGLLSWRRGRLEDPIQRKVYKLDSDGALWQQNVRRNMSIEEFVPAEWDWIPANQKADGKYKSAKHKEKQGAT